MPANRSELDAALYQLHAALPLWRDVVESDDALLDHYGEKLADLVSEASPTDKSYAVAQASHLIAETYSRTASRGAPVDFDLI